MKKALKSIHWIQWWRFLKIWWLPWQQGGGDNSTLIFVNINFFPLGTDASDQIWKRSGMWFQRKSCLIFFQFFYIRHIRKIGPAHPGGHVFLDINLIFTIYMRSHLISVAAKYCWNPPNGFWVGEFLRFFYIRHIRKMGVAPVVAMFFNGTKFFEQLW